MERRGFLRWVVASAIVVGTTLTATDLITSLLKPTLITVNVMYSQMTQIVNVKEEVFTLQDSATISDLLSAIAMRHPSLTPTMMAGMLMLVNGVSYLPGGLDFTLKDGDEVEFISMMAGG